MLPEEKRFYLFRMEGDEKGKALYETRLSATPDYVRVFVNGRFRNTGHRGSF